MVDTVSELGGDSPVVKKRFDCNFSRQILKSLVGLEKAE